MREKYRALSACTSSISRSGVEEPGNEASHSMQIGDCFWGHSEAKVLKQMLGGEITFLLVDAILDYHSKVDKIVCATFQIVFAILHQAMQSMGSAKCYIQNRTGSYIMIP